MRWRAEPDRRHAPARRRGRLGALGLVGVLAATGLTACSSSPPPPPATLAAQQFVAAWNHDDATTLSRLSLGAPRHLGHWLEGVTTRLQATSASHVLVTVRGRGTTRTATVASRYGLGGLGSWTATGTLAMTLVGQAWKVHWSPGWFDPALGADDHLTLSIGAWPTRAAILGVGGAPLTTTAPMVTIGLLGSRMANPQALTAGLLQVGIPSAQVTAAEATATAQPTLFVPLETLPEAQYDEIKPVVYPLPGTVFQETDYRTAISPDLGQQIVGALGPITAAQVASMGLPYQPGDAIGQYGIEAAYERQLAGTPSASVSVVDSTGHQVKVLHFFPAQAGTTVQTTIDPSIQHAAELALNDTSDAAALVAIQPSTGDVLASVSRPTDGYNNALLGKFPPGSTFKVITSTDLLEHGWTPSSTTSCPATITEGGETFHNFEGEAAASLTMEHAFAESCNAAFIGMSANLPDSSFPAAAAQFGLGTTIKMGLPAFAGSVPTPDSDAVKAATSIGQAQVVVSPLDMASVAATAASGELREPRLVAGAPDDTFTPQPLPAGVDASLKVMMADVVSDGTAADEGLPAGTYGKTGTAEFGNANPPATHAWFIGFNGNIAFCVLVVGGGIGGAVAAPIAARFLDNLGI